MRAATERQVISELMKLRHLARAIAIAPLLVALTAPFVHADPPKPAAVRTAPVTAAKGGRTNAPSTALPHPGSGAFAGLHGASATPASVIAKTRSNARLRARAPGHVATPSLDVAIPHAAAREELRSVRAEVVRQVQAGRQPFVIFDIDDTLLSWPRPAAPRQEVPGALPYLASLKTAGAKIVYLTGRSKPAEKETIEHLKAFGFPLGPNETLILKDSKARPTVDFKADATRRLVATMKTKPVAVFDNEKENARMFREVFPDKDVAIIRPRTFSQRSDPGGTGPVTVVEDFSAAF